MHSPNPLGSKPQSGDIRKCDHTTRVVFCINRTRCQIICCFTMQKRLDGGRVCLRPSELCRGRKKSFPSTHPKNLQLGPYEGDQQKTN